MLVSEARSACSWESAVVRFAAGATAKKLAGARNSGRRFSSIGVTRGPTRPPGHITMTQMTHQLTEMDDIAALRRYAGSADPQAFEVLAARYQAMVLAICRRTLGNEADAEDAAQETFLRLARSAKAIRSNAAAWLHSCAMNTCRDLMRRKGAAPAEQAASAMGLENVPDSGEPETARLWRDIEPLLDAALADLSDEDRDVIVARFLAGRPLNELAEQAGVAAGTMSRRVERALANLRKRLGSAALGVSAAGAGAHDVLAGVLQHGTSTYATSASVTASIAKIPLTGIGATLATTSAARNVAAIIVAASLGVGTIGASAWYLLPTKAAAITAATAFDPKAKFERPKKETEPVDLFSTSSNDQPLSNVRIDGNTMDLRVAPAPDGSWYGMVFEILECTPQKPPKGMDAKGTLKVKLTSTNFPEEPRGIDMKVIHEEVLDGSYEVRGDRIRLTQGTPQREENYFRMHWSGSRWDESKPVTAGDPTPAQLAAHKPRPSAVFEKEPLLAGTWREQPPLEIKLSEQNIYINVKGIEGTLSDRYRIIEWTAAEGYAKVQLIVARSYDPTRVGKRFKALIRKDEKGYTTATHMWTSKNMDVWPGGFDAKMDPALSVQTWKSEDAR